MTVQSFRTLSGVVVPAITADQMREVDRVAIEEVGPNLFQMMENAGRNLAGVVIETMGAGWRSAPVVVLAGTGGNGGGGICAARHLANRGADVTVVISDSGRLGQVPAEQLRVFRGSNGRVVEPFHLGSLDAALVVDAVVGYNLSGPLQGVAADMVLWARDQPGPVVSLDVPSGINATSGASDGVHVRAQTCLTLALPKSGLDVAAVGELWLGDIGIPAEVYRRVGVDVPTGLFGSDFRVRLN